MINLITILFIFILLVTQKILLLNEESLILLCFICFIALGLNNLGTSVSISLENQSKEIKKTLIDSLLKEINAFKEFKNFSKKLNTFLKKFKEFKKYYETFIVLISSLILNYTKYNLFLNYNKKLNFITKIEDQTIKILLAVIIKKLNSIIKLKYFYNSSIEIKKFTTVNQILIRECIQLLNSNKN